MKTTAAVAVLLALSPARATEVTVYNSNLGLIKQTREFDLKAGVGELRVDDVAANIDPTSVHFKSLPDPDAVRVLEQDFRYDLASPEAVLNRYLGREVTLEREVGRDGGKTESITGVLLSNSGGRVIESGGRILIDPPGHPVLKALPEGLTTKPTLVWTVEAKRGGRQKGEISYLTAGLSWSADYVLVVDKTDSRADLTAWTTIVNNSGATYKDARLKLVAGDVHRAPTPLTRRFALAMGAMAKTGGPAMQEQPFFEYHIYTPARRTTLADNSSKQVEMASAQGVAVKKLFVYDGAGGQSWYGGDAGNWDPDYGTEGNKKVGVYFEFKNSAASGLGIALPKGRVRVYKADGDGSLQLAGEDSIDHTPKDETVRVKMGDAFDVVGERKRVDYSSDTKRRRFEESFEIRVRNHKDASVDVAVIERLYRWSGWKIVKASSKWIKKDAQTVEFPVTVPKDGEAVVDYTVRYDW